MADVNTRRRHAHPLRVHQDNAQSHVDRRDDGPDELNDESRNPLEDSGCTRSASSEDESDIDDHVLEDMKLFEDSFKGIGRRYRLINRIGEGTFSTVYKAEDLYYEHYRNEWDQEATENHQSTPSRKKSHRKPHYVAIKKIYVTSSPSRIMNELDLLHSLRRSESVCPLITAFRHQDQVIAVLPYFRHLDFRSYFRDMTVVDMRIYFRSLFTALAAIHEQNILHRDIKPTNFLYDMVRKRGVVVDFGLAEREGTDHQPCLCQQDERERRRRQTYSYYMTREPLGGYPNKDQRPSIRANRAGTRGFRAPEVLFKCTAQTTKVDIWSAGIILLTILCKRFPFFNSADDIDAVVELSTVFGLGKMKAAAMQHGQVLETNIPTIPTGSFPLDKIVMWSQNRPTKDKHGNRLGVRREEAEVIEFLNTCLELDPSNRISAKEALKHPFLAEKEDEGSEDDMDVLSMEP